MPQTFQQLLLWKKVEVGVLLVLLVVQTSWLMNSLTNYKLMTFCNKKKHPTASCLLNAPPPHPTPLSLPPSPPPLPGGPPTRARLHIRISFTCWSLFRPASGGPSDRQTRPPARVRVQEMTQ